MGTKKFNCPPDNGGGIPLISGMLLKQAADRLGAVDDQGRGRYYVRHPSVCLVYCVRRRRTVCSSRGGGTRFAIKKVDQSISYNGEVFTQSFDQVQFLTPER